MDHFSTPAARPGLTPYVQRVCIAVGITVLILALTGLLGLAFGVFLRLLAALLIALPLRAGAEWLHRRIGLPTGLAVALLALLMLGLLGGIGWLFSAKLSEQLSGLQQQLPKAIEDAQARISGTEWGQRLAGEDFDYRKLMGGTSEWLGRATGIFSTTFSILADGYVILFLAIFLVIQPKTYRAGLVMLVPKASRARAHEVLDKVSSTLVNWVLGRLASMLFVGVLTVVGLSFLGMPLAVALGLFAGLVTFIPNIGPVVSMVPALLLAFFNGGPHMALYVLLLYLAAQTLESAAVSPVLQQRLISLPPALILVGQLVIGSFTGLLGLTLATPIIAILTVLVKMLYVQDVLGDEEVNV
ncbi:AI-2E family transporter [Hymenobacter sp. H14-R3]|uniref:AI-2E family transporter n=1 Tax=Hymenobacter sp. H14-R3 TaxID=3046308 RepID=UPI0024BBAD06|nr:AI-2E family transporter [Hymenobacter sp. H14-R3]MDJ0365313.1 AI-2E family transporter [Hymenobacter sp. H14-R3]